MALILATWMDDFRSPFPFVIWAAVSLVVGLSGPFGSYVALDLPERLMFWAGIIGLGVLAGSLLRAIVTVAFGLRDFQRGAFLVAVLSSVLMTGPLYALADRMFDHGKAEAPSVADISLFIFAISLSVGAVRAAREGDAALHLTPIPDPGTEEEAMALPRIVQRLDSALQGRLVAMTVRDHYVDVFTTAGRGSVLIRFADAMQEAEGEEGVQIHRSHWVALWTVRGIERESGKIFVRLCPELRLPVSRSHRPKLEERGLL